MNMSWGRAKAGRSLYKAAGCLYSEVQGEQVLNMSGVGFLRSNASWVMVRWDPYRQTDRQTDMTENITIATPLPGGKNSLLEN